MRMLFRPFNALAALFGLQVRTPSAPIGVTIDEMSPPRRRSYSPYVFSGRVKQSGSHGKDTANGAGAMARRKRQDAYERALNADIANPTISDEAFAARYPEIAGPAFKGWVYAKSPPYSKEYEQGWQS